MPQHGEAVNARERELANEQSRRPDPIDVLGKGRPVRAVDESEPVRAVV